MLDTRLITAEGMPCSRSDPALQDRDLGNGPQGSHQGSPSHLELWQSPVKRHFGQQQSGLMHSQHPGLRCGQKIQERLICALDITLPGSQLNKWEDTLREPRVGEWTPSPPHPFPSDRAPSQLPSEDRKLSTAS